MTLENGMRRWLKENLNTSSMWTEISTYYRGIFCIQFQMIDTSSGSIKIKEDTTTLECGEEDRRDGNLDCFGCPNKYFVRNWNAPLVSTDSRLSFANARTTYTANLPSFLFLFLFPFGGGFDSVSLEPEPKTLRETRDEMLDEITMSSYVFKLLEKDNDESPRPCRRHELGVNHNKPSPESRRCQVTVKVTVAASSSYDPDRRRGRPSTRSPRSDGATAVSNGIAADGAGCPLLPGVAEEILGSCSDLR